MGIETRAKKLKTTFFTLTAVEREARGQGLKVWDNA